jgi:SAM-dependent methyltransferase
MSIEKSQGSWKKDFYHSYSTNTGRSSGNAQYREYIPYGRHIIKCCFPPGKNIRILDLGCGIGGFLKVFLDDGYINIRGVDLSNENIEIAHANGLFQVEKGDLKETLDNTPDTSTDLVLCLDVIEHLERAEAIEVLKNIYRILKHQGCVVLHVPNAEGLFGSKIRYADLTHEMAYTSSSLGQLLKYTGFQKYQCFEDKPVIHGLHGFLRRIGWVFFTIPVRVMHGIETGSFTVILSQNMLAIGRK